MTENKNNVVLINQFLRENFILSLTCQGKESESKNISLWSANCFYIASHLFFSKNINTSENNMGVSELTSKKGKDEATIFDLFFMSSPNTRHGQMLHSNPHVTGTIATSTREVKSIEGIQYCGLVSLLNTKEDCYESILAEYQSNFEEAKLLVQPLWRLKFLEVKYTRNFPKFGEKFYWSVNDKN